jgi:hypothetical protein
VNWDGDLSGFIWMDEMLVATFRGIKNISMFFRFLDELLGKE